VLVRRRQGADLDRCAQLAETVHRVDGYPSFLQGDLRSFLTGPGAVAGWVAEDGEAIVGHVGLHASSSDAVMALAAEATGWPAQRLGVVARLLVAPSTRRLGAGRSLLAAAATAAAERDLWPILDVVPRFEAARRLYEASGWVCAGRVTVRLPDASTIDELVYIGPAPNSFES
jgi:GNAT superfamily N-acetyltransferase